MLNKQQAQKLAALLHSKEWPQMEEYLAELREVTIQAVVTAQSESELRQTQGKLGLLEMLLKLKSSHEAVVKNGN
jgi:beta-phosphoglucomutase-like phosphatase (HAD superfamily)